MKQAFRLTPVIAALGVAAGLAFSAGAQAQTIKIGVVGPTTGAVTQYGDMVREGVDTAVERINAAGGINGKKLDVYKRQPPDHRSAVRPAAAAPGLRAARRQRVLGDRPAGLHPRQGQRPEPVSYTHLDVYKRQPEVWVTWKVPGFLAGVPFAKPYCRLKSDSCSYPSPEGFRP